MITEEEQRLQKRFCELAEKTYRQNIFSFTDFLGLGEQTLFHQVSHTFHHVKTTLYGGHPSCERLMVRFGDPAEIGYEEAFPIVCLRIGAKAPKFAENLTHRDYLGALVNLGLERSTMGDILVGDKEAYTFCMENIAPFICDNLDRVRHTAVTCQIVESVPESALPNLVERSVNVASERLDALIAAVFHLSRSQCLELFRSGKIFVGGRLYENNSGQPKAGELISVRGYGRFLYDGVQAETKKGRRMARVRIYS
jgi:RNA-binding protein YlmH